MTRLVDDVVWHSTGQNRPHFAWHQAFYLADADAELEELLHSEMQTRPLVAVLVVAGVQERHSATARLLELVGQLVEQRCDFLLVAGEPLGVETDIADDAFRLHVLAGVLAVLEEAVEEDGFNPLGVEFHYGVSFHRVSFRL